MGPKPKPSTLKYVLISFFRRRSIKAIGLLLLVSPYAYRYYRDYTFHRDLPQWERDFFKTNLGAPVGPTLDVSAPNASPLYDVVDLGMAIPVDLAPDGSLMYKYPPETKDSGSMYRWKHFVRTPNGKKRYVGEGAFCFTTDGKVVQVLDSPNGLAGFYVDDVEVKTNEAELSKICTSGIEPATRPISTDGKLFASGRLTHHHVSVFDAVKQQSYVVPPPPDESEPFWAAGLRLIGAARKRSPSDYLYDEVAMTSDGIIFATTTSSTNLYLDHRDTNCRVARIQNGNVTILPNPDGYRFNALSRYSNDGEVVLHRYTECTAFCWPYRHTGSRYEPIPLPKGSRDGYAVGVGSKDQLLVLARVGKTSLETLPFVFTSGRYYDFISAIPKEFRTGLQFEYFGDYGQRIGFRYRLGNPVSKSGHVVAVQKFSQTKGRLLLFCPKETSL